MSELEKELAGESEYQDLDKMDLCRGHGMNLQWKPSEKRFPSLIITHDKFVLTNDEVVKLLTGSFIVQEKLLGTTRPVRWKDDPTKVLYFCDMLIERYVGYNWGLPGRHILFAVTTYGTKERRPFSEVQQTAAQIGFPTVDRGNLGVYSNGIKEEDIPTFLDNLVLDERSAYGDQGNGGFVIISEDDLTLVGKYCRYEGVKGDAWQANFAYNKINED